MSDIALESQKARRSLLPEEYRGLWSWLTTVDHKQLGILYIVACFVFFLGGGLEAMLMRAQLMHSRSIVLGPSTYNQVFTMHGTTMIFLVVVPILIGLGVYFVPLMIGARDLAFPRLNALSFWVFVLGGLLIYFSFLGGGMPSAGGSGGANAGMPQMGWFSYAPLSELPYTSSRGTDYWALGLLAVGVGTVSGAINMIVTILKYRAPGMSLRRVPLFVWMVLCNSFIILFALPPLNDALTMLLIDRQLVANFFTPATGGSAILWQQFFWAFGHPEVYIMVLPAWGIISEVIPVFSRKPIFGYEFVAASSVAIALLSFAVYAHHMFAVGLGHPWNAAFAAASFTIAVPTGIKIFNWAATMVGGKIRFTTSMLFAIAFIIQFTMGGISGVTFAAIPTDWQTTDTYYVVAHFHYVLFGGTAFALFAGLFYWFPKMTGRMLSEKLGKLQWLLAVVGFNTTFLVQHILGLQGMARRVHTYPALPGYNTMNLVSSIGAFILGFSVVVFLVNVFVSLRNGRLAGDNPWDAWTLEWATSSPPPVENFQQVPPIHGRRPLWDLNHPDKPDWKLAQEGEPEAI
jgi:cytochrome c oxidase subunit I